MTWVWGFIVSGFAFAFGVLYRSFLCFYCLSMLLCALRHMFTVVMLHIIVCLCVCVWVGVADQSLGPLYPKKCLRCVVSHVAMYYYRHASL